MVAIAGVWYSRAAAANAPARRKAARGYLIDQRTLERIAGKLAMAPITYEHKGLRAAADTTETGAQARRALATVGATQFRKTANPSALAMQPIGAVTSAWVTSDGTGHFTGQLLNNMGAVNRLVETNMVAGVSLTHDDATAVPVEITMTTEPARPGCRVVATGLKAVSQYKRRGTKRMKQHAAMDTQQETPKVEDQRSPLEIALAALDNPARAAIEARMEEMVAAADAATSRAKQLEAQGTDYAVMRDQLDMINGQLTDRQRKLYNIQPETVKAQLESNNQQRILGATNRLLMACSARMMELGDGDGPAAKRARSAEAAPPAAAAAAPEFAAPSDGLRRALAASFEMQ